MKVTVDGDLCEANAVCAGLVPEVFEVDEEDNLHILTADVPESLAAGVRHAVWRCPRGALSIQE
ncbi:MAG: ferredoxin [Streptosporangiaceae bacterium]